MVGLLLVKPYCGSVLQRVGSRTTSMVNSGSMRVPSDFRGGQGKKTRMRPRSSSSECEAGSSCGRLGQFLPSMAANSGSLPLVSRHRSRAVAAEIVIASDGWWHVRSSWHEDYAVKSDACHANGSQFW